MPGDSLPDDLARFRARHADQLPAVLPASLHAVACVKLRDQLFDAGEALVFAAEGDRFGGRALCARRRLQQQQQQQSELWLVDHVVSAPAEQFSLEALEAAAPAALTLLCRVCNLDQCEETTQETTEETTQELSSSLSLSLLEKASRAGRLPPLDDWPRTRELNLDGLGVTDAELADAGLAEHFPALECLSLWDGALTSAETLRDALAGMTQLRALWLAGCPVAASVAVDGHAGGGSLGSLPPTLELLDRRVVPGRGGEWAARFVVEHGWEAESGTLDLSDRGLDAALLPALLPALARLPPGAVRRLCLERNAPGFALALLLLDNPPALLATLEELSTDRDVGALAPLLARLPPTLARLNGLDRRVIAATQPDESGSLRERLRRRLKSYVGFVQVDETLHAYFADPVGAAINHSCAPNCALLPLVYYGVGPEPASPPSTVSLLWPLGPIEPGTELVRDYAANVSDPAAKRQILQSHFRHCLCGEPSCLLPPPPPA